MFMALIFMTNDSDDIMMFFFACTLHELGHLSAMYILGAKSKSVYISGLGIKIVQSSEKLISSERNLIILLSGPFLNLLIFYSGIFSEAFSQMNIILFAFNMLPFRKLDGGSILILISEIFHIEYAMEIFIKGFAILAFIAVFFALYFFGLKILSLCAVILYYCFSEFFEFY